MNLEVNESFFDRMIRAVVGLIVFYFGITGIVQGVVGILLVVIGVYLLLSAALGFCIFYKLFKFHTNPS